MIDIVKVLFAKKEAVYATDAGPTGAVNAALTRNFTAKPVVMDRIARNLDRPVRGRSKDGASNARQTFSYELELAGPGGAIGAGPPAWMEHLQACGMDPPVVTAGVSAVQKFAAVGTFLSSLTAYHWHGSQRRVGLGARGTFSGDFTAGAYPFVKLDMTALLPATPDFGVTDAAPGAVALGQWGDPLEVNTANTAFSLDGYAAKVRSFTFDVNADIKPRNLVGANYINRGNHALTGKLMIEAPLIATKNYLATLKGGTEVVLQLIHGVAPGNIVQVDMAHVQVTDIDLQEEDDKLMFSCALGMNVGTTPDDLVITAK